MIKSPKKDYKLVDAGTMQTIWHRQSKFYKVIVIKKIKGNAVFHTALPFIVQGLLLFKEFFIVGRGHPYDFFESAREIIDRVKSTCGGNLYNRQLVCSQ